MSVARLSEEFRVKAEGLREVAADAQASTLDWCAARIDEVLRGSDYEELTVEEAEVVSGYTRRHLRRLVRSGTIPAEGTGADVRILRKDVPRKPGYGSMVAGHIGSGPSSRVQLARTVANGG